MYFLANITEKRPEVIGLRTVLYIPADDADDEDYDDGGNEEDEDYGDDDVEERGGGEREG